MWYYPHGDRLIADSPVAPCTPAAWPSLAVVRYCGLLTQR